MSGRGRDRVDVSGSVRRVRSSVIDVSGGFDGCKLRVRGMEGNFS